MSSTPVAQFLEGLTCESKAAGSNSPKSPSLMTWKVNAEIMRKTRPEPQSRTNFKRFHKIRPRDRMLPTLQITPSNITPPSIPVHPIGPQAHPMHAIGSKKFKSSLFNKIQL